MLTQNDKQWIEENEIIDRYILEQLNVEDKVRFSALLASSEELREETEFSAMVAAAVRQFSRTELKRKIKTAVKESGIPSASPAHHATRPSHYWLYIRAAALILIFLGGVWMFYLWMSGDKSPAPITEDQSVKTLPVKEKNLPPPKQETISEYREPVKKDKPKKTAKTEKKSEEKRPQLLSMPADTMHARSVQKFTVNPALYPKTNEVKASLELTDEKKQIETKILFKNPTDLSAVNITATSEEAGGKLMWFYVHYENQVLNVYLDNTKYLNMFKNSKLIQQKQALLIVLEKSSYQVDMKDQAKFRKAVIAK